ncbi:MAG: calcium/sodium antiporter [Clostridia bacterium]|nr:calcium/sodium antiporter [Clostridia bacterium]
MESIIHEFLNGLPTVAIALAIIAMLYTLSKGADIFVDEAVSLSVHFGIPKVIIGATIVSLGTTLPEASVSVMAAINGNPDLALGNAIGSIIVDTGLIIGLASLLGKLPVDQKTIDRQGKIQWLAVVLLALVSLPFFSANGVGRVHQWMGFVFIALLIAYIYISIKWSRQDHAEIDEIHEEKAPLAMQLLKLGLGVAIVILSSKVLIPAVEIGAYRVGIPQSIIAATLVAFGTSLPELVTAVTAVRKGHGELAVGNIVGADILNVLFVVGSAAAVTAGGLEVPTVFFKLQIPTMLLIVTAFRFFAKGNDQQINKKEGTFLIVIYVIYLTLNYL